MNLSPWYVHSSEGSDERGC